MSFDALRATEQFLNSQYSGLLGLTVVSGVQREVLDGSLVRWQWQGPDLRNVDQIDAATGGVVLDADIGICLYIQLYQPETDLASQLARALAVRSELLPGRVLTAKDPDLTGEWHVAVHWLVEKSLLPGWIAKMAKLRQDTAHFEEVPVDAIVSEASDWHVALRRHGIHRLLFQTRATLAHKDLDETRRWASADEIVRNGLQGIANTLNDQKMAPYVRRLLKKLAETKDSDQQQLRPIVEPRRIHAIAMENFRNVPKLSLDLIGTNETVAANVVHGPNGTGKSAILEALSLGVGSVSQRYLEFVQDPNVTGSDKRQSYLVNYLTPIQSPSSTPRLAINGAALREIVLAAPDEASEGCAKLSGNILLNSASSTPLSRRASELGAEIAGGYSIVAASIMEWLDRMLLDADAKRDAFNRRFGLKTTTSRDNTARVRIAEGKITGALSVSDHVLQWLRTASGPFISRDQKNLALEWDAFHASQASSVKELAAFSTKEEVGQGVKSILTKRNELLVKIDATLHRAQLAKTNIADTLPSDVKAWGEWVSAGTRQALLIETDEVTNLRDQLEKASAKVAAITREGQALRERLKHLSDMRTFLQVHWLPTHPQTCPTCNTHFTHPLGFSDAIARSEQGTNDELEAQRHEYKAAQEEISRVTGLLNKAGATPPPSYALTQLQAIFGSALDTGALAEESYRSDLIDTIGWLRRVPIVSGFSLFNEKLEVQIKQVTDELWEAFEEQALVSMAPECWKKLRSHVVDVFTAAVRDHLPHRLQALWLELNANITPALWQYPGAIDIDVQQKRNQMEARVVVRSGQASPLASHILNSAEVHSLTVAWFLTRYLTWGRFHLTLLGLDDPAQQMDQPTFRDLCRLLEALLRLHRRKRKELTLVLFLHQDERALDAGRAMNARLHFLRWNDGSAASLETKAMRTGAQLPRKPYEVIKSA